MLFSQRLQFTEQHTHNKARSGKLLRADFLEKQQQV